MAQYKTVGNLKIRTDLSPEKQALVNQIAKNYVNEQKAINKSYLKDMARMVGGTAISGASFLPILNIPGVGAAIGGGMYDLGQGIVEGDKARDLVKRAARGAAIGAVIPPAAKKIAATKAGQAVGKQLTKVAEKAAENPAVQKAYDALMTDIKGFNPNKQTMYHGSPYDFNKFSNEAIGTGEGAQAHGMGHYAALNKDVSENYRKNLSFYANPEKKEITWRGITHKLDTQQKYDSLLSYIENIENGIPKSTNGQLYKLSIPKDDVMLREDEFFNYQPQPVQDKLWDLGFELSQKGGRGHKNLLNALAENKTGKQIYETIWDMYNDADIYGADGASKLLNSKGIKGISYNGGIDGESAVIFNPDDIDIVRKYYNQPTLKDIYNKFINSGAIADAITNP